MLGTPFLDPVDDEAAVGAAELARAEIDFCYRERVSG
jgi:hypothetical protein